MVAQSKRIFISLGVLLLAAAACQPPAVVTPTQGLDDLALTATAIVQTLSAQNSATPLVVITATFPAEGIPSATELPPIVSETASPVVGPPTVTVTASPGVPMVSVTVGTNCRTGPGRVYDRIGGAPVGVKFVIVGKHTPSNYWIIRLQDGRECWLWGQHAVVEGNVNSLPELNAPPRPTPLPALGTILVTVRGPDLSGENTALVQNATVTLVSTGEQAQNLGNGTYSFRNVSFGWKDIRAATPNHDPGFGSVNVVSGTQASPVEIHVVWSSPSLASCARFPTPAERRNCYVAVPFPSQIAPPP